MLTDSAELGPVRWIFKSNLRAIFLSCLCTAKHLMGPYLNLKKIQPISVKDRFHRNDILAAWFLASCLCCSPFRCPQRQDYWCVRIEALDTANKATGIHGVATNKRFTRGFYTRFDSSERSTAIWPRCCFQAGCCSVPTWGLQIPGWKPNLLAQPDSD